MTATPIVAVRSHDDPAGATDRLWRRWWDLAARHPVRTVLVVALAVRVLAASLINLVGFQIPDEKQYIDLAATVASGRSAEEWVAGYGQALYDSTIAFTGSLTALYQVTGPSRFTGQLLAGVAGAVTAALTTRLLRPAGARTALAAGLIVALMPSQVLWSSVVLRESFVWLGAVVVAVAVAEAARSTRASHLAACLAAAAAGLLLLGHLRDQTMLVLAYALALAPWFYRPARGRWAQRAAALALAFLVPVATGIGVAGYDLVVRAVPNLAVARANLSIGADSAIGDRGSDAASQPGAKPDAAAGPAAPAGEPAADAPTDPEPSGPGYLVTQQPGVTIESEGATSELSYLPTGLVAVTLRPFPWESGSSLSLLFARMENLVWLVLYAFALLGAPAAWRHRRTMAFPVIGLVGVLLSSALTQGNLGTAFRHRSQVLWAVAALAALGAAVAFERRRRRDDGAAADTPATTA